jgi:hypothetical protein
MAEKKRKYRKLNPSPKLVELIVGIVKKHLTRKEAAIQAGYSSKNPDQSAYQALKRAQTTFPQLMEEHGLTDSVLIEKYLVPLMRATRKKYFQYKGKVRDSRKEAALDIRENALDMAFRLKGSYAPVSVETERKQTVSVIVLDVPRPAGRPAPPVGQAIEVTPLLPAEAGTNGNQHKKNGRPKKPK